MRKFAGIALIVFVIARAASAQIPTSGNIFIGYSYSRSEVAPGAHTVNINGWEGSLEGKLLPWVGIVADFVDCGAFVCKFWITNSRGF